MNHSRKGEITLVTALVIASVVARYDAAAIA